MMAVQICGILYRDEEDLMFKHLMATLTRSKYDNVRRKILKLLKVPDEVSAQFKAQMVKFLGPRLTDSDKVVRVESF